MKKELGFWDDLEKMFFKFLFKAMTLKQLIGM